MQTVLLLAVQFSMAAGTLTGDPGGCWAGGFTFPANTVIIDSYIYNPSQAMETLPASFDDYTAVDDYSCDFVLLSYTCWGVTTGSAPSSLEMLHVPDGGGFPVGAPTSHESYMFECDDTGYTFAGYPIWQVYMFFNSGPYFTYPGWLGTHRSDGINWYVACGTEITGNEAYRTLAAGWAWQPFSASIGPGDIFKIIEDPSFPAVTGNTWAGIKTTFTGGNE